MGKNKLSLSVESKIYAWIVALLPVLTLYKSPIDALDFGTFLGLPIILICFLSLSRKEKKMKPEMWLPRKYGKRFLHVCLYMGIVTCISSVIGLTYDMKGMGFDDKIQMLFRCAKLVLTALVIVYCGFKLMNFAYFLNVYWLIIKLAILYIVLQTLCFYAFKKVLPPFIAGLIREDYSYILDYNYHVGIGLFRPMSFFYEPAHFSEYCIPYLTYTLFANRKISDVHFTRAICISLGIVLSTSGIGCGLTVILWAIVLIRSLISGKNKKVVGMAVIVLCCLPILFRIPLFQKAFERLFRFGDSQGAIQIRMGSGYAVFWGMGLLAQLFGIGYGNYPPSYAISMSYSLISLGIAGTVLLVLFLFEIIRKNTGFPRALACVFFLMMFVTMIFSTGFSLYLPCIIFSVKEREKSKRYFPVPQTVQTEKIGDSK